jgi:acyl transferase domain-containing protein/3-hydroxymyristoyl/3-hydroxydecanoyl-(acyl carrier protein) dehydratase
MLAALGIAAMDMLAGKTFSRSQSLLSASSQIAIVGMGAVFPNSGSIEEFWQHVLAGRSLSREVPEGRWPLSTADAYAPDIAPDKVYSTRGCFVDGFRCDPEGLAIDPALLERLDPLFHILLRAGRDAWRDTVTTDVDKGRVGIIIGNIALPTDASSAFSDELLMPLLEAQVLGRRLVEDAERTEPLNRYVAGLPAGILAKALGLGGGSFTLDAACASSLYALKLAAEELRAGRADIMLTGGVSRPDCLYTQMGFSQLHALSPSGNCAPFDASADGLVVGEGAGILTLKRLEDALRDGDHIYATIAGIGLSNDIAGNLMQPDSRGQVRAMRAAYAEAGWTPADVDLVECHGTGTPVGDAVELNSLHEVWGGGASGKKCVLGSVKSNVGHLLTAAGSAGLIKVLLAMRECRLPPTANFSMLAEHSETDAFSILQRPIDWPRPAAHPRRAAISGFGFGGINAHVLLESWEGAPAAIIRAVPDEKPSAVAIVGMGAHFGPWETLDAFRDRIFGQRGELAAAPTRWWGSDVAQRFRGFFVDEVAIPLGRFRVPPAELAEMLPQQLLMLQAAADAFDDAGLGNVSAERLDTGVFIGIGLDLNTTNFHFRWTVLNQARRWARELDLGLTDSEIDGWADQLREAAGPALNANRTMGALGGIVASRVARAFHIGGPSFTISSEETSSLHAIQTAVGALRRGELNVALVGGVDLAGDLRAAVGGGAATIGEGAAAVVLKRHEDALRDGDRVYALIDGSSSAGISIDAASDIGHAGAATGIASVVKAALSLHHEVHGKSYWLRNRADGPRQATVHVSNISGHHAQVSLTAATATRCDPKLRECFFAVIGQSNTELLENLQKLVQLVADGDGKPLESTARRWFRAQQGAALRGLSVGFVAESREQMRELISRAREAVEAGERLAGDRVFYSPQPLGADGVAFVFPGAGNAFAGMGRELATAFPAILRKQDAENQRLASQFAEGRYWSGESIEGILERDAIFAQVSLGTFLHDLLRHFGVKPAAVIGYSLGETTGLFATRAWGTGTRDEMLARMEQSTLFTSDLAGQCDAARAAWKLSANEDVDWVVGVVDRAGEVVRTAIEGDARVYLLIVNTVNECVIGGDRGAVERLVREMECQFHRVSGVTTVHCDVARSVEAAYRELHLLETTAPAGVKFYSGATGESYAVTREAAAESIVRQAMGPFDFSKVIERAYAEGARVFVETGPGASCSRMIDAILGERPHVARSVCMAGPDGVGAFLRVLAQLASEGVPVSLEGLYGDGGENLPELPPGKVVRVRPGGNAFKVPQLPMRRKYERVELIELRMPEWANSDVAVGEDVMGSLVEQMAATQIAHARAQETFLRVSQNNLRAMSEAIALQMTLAGGADVAAWEPSVVESVDVPARAMALDRDMCMEFAVGSVGRVLGAAFAHVDAYPTRVRLPDEPLMLVDRIVTIEGEANSMTSGRVVTEHDVHAGAWYLDGGRIPTCIAVEAGQADLFLSGYLGIDSITRGQAVYRLLDAVVTFHGPLPRAGERIVYDIVIDHFFRQGETYLFRFHFDATVNGEKFLTMRKGCAGFFSEAELAAGQGIVLTSIDKRAAAGKRPADWRELVPMGVERYGDEQVEALRRGDLAGCFGAAFSGLPLREAAGLPGRDGGRMTLVHRVLSLDPHAGRYGLGQITGEADIHPDDWFLTCHFVDDRVMPGTLMYECCLHTLRIYLLRMGWVGEASAVAYEPVAGVAGQLKCRGQVTASTKKVQYEVTLKEIGYQEDGTPYVVADALMSGDGRAIVQMTNMSVQLSGLTRAGIEGVWKSRSQKSEVRSEKEIQSPVIFDEASIRAFAVGNPSEAFGDRYRMFDLGERRKIARLPGPPFQFLDRVTRIEGCEPWVLKAGGTIEAEYDVPADAWYFHANQQDDRGEMPFAVLLEIALQPCGWFAAYLGSALTSDVDMRFRNLGGSATQLRAVAPDVGTLTTTIKMTSVSNSGGMIIQHYNMAVRCAAGEVYRGNTYFGFFSKEALATQIGIRDAARYEPSAIERATAHAFPYPEAPPFPDEQMRMVDRIDLFAEKGGPKELGFIRGTTTVDASAWFFKAHFFEDPVWPGSLGLESFLQLLKVVAHRRWGGDDDVCFETVARGEKHTWIYRGQIIPADREVTVEAVITQIDDEQRLVRADGFLVVDGRVIYQMRDFAIKMGRSA